MTRFVYVPYGVYLRFNKPVQVFGLKFALNNFMVLTPYSTDLRNLYRICHWFIRKVLASKYLDVETTLQEIEKLENQYWKIAKQINTLESYLEKIK